ncbi:MAG: HesA/MoeB/ThiF family protein [Syntrophomonadaceae bacterium]
METGLTEMLVKKARNGILPWSEQAALVQATGLSLREVEAAALQLGIIPAHYSSNQGAISITEQLKLLNSRAAVIGCGGLGGYVIEQLARLGVGEIQAWDGDVFEEKNLNRQLFAQIPTMGKSKVLSAAARVEATNPAVQLIGYAHPFKGTEDAKRLKGAAVVIDALDNIPSRLLLARVCKELQIPLVHGAIDGWYGQVITQFPDESTVEQIYAHYRAGQDEPVKPPALSFVPAVIASLEVAQALKVILGRGDLRRGQLLAVDLLSMDIDTLEIGS